MTKDPRIPALLEAKIAVSEGLAILRFRLEEPMVFTPGQYATLWLTHRDKTIPRPYSIASSPAASPVLEFYINLVEHGRLTPSLWDPEVLEALQTRSRDAAAAVSGPKGRFVLDPEDTRDLVFVASGTGLAPFMSMIRKLREDFLADPMSFHPRRLYVIHGVSYSSNLGYHEELSKMATTTQSDPRRRLLVVYIPTISRPAMDPEWRGLIGRAETLFEDAWPITAHKSEAQLVAEKLLRTVLKPETHVVYVCGHPGTVDNMARILAPQGFRLDVDLRRERYYP